MRLVVENLPQDFPVMEVQKAFEPYGQFEVVKTQKSAVWLQFAEEQKAREALQALHDSDLGGNRIQVHEFLGASNVTAEEKRSRSRSRSRSPAKETQTAEVAPAPAPTDASDQSPAKQETKPADAPQPAPSDAAAPDKTEGVKVGPAVGETITEDDGSKFLVVKVNTKNDGLSSWKCLACNRSLQRKSVKSHIASKTHKQRATASN